MSNNVLLIGGSGFLGTALAEKFAQRDMPFTVLSRSRMCPPRLARVIHEHKKLAVYVSGDCRDEELIEEVISRHGPIIYLAYTNMRGVSSGDPTTELRDNLSSSTVVFKAAARHQRQVLVASSGGTVYGSSDPIPIKETHPTVPISSYGKTKVAIEKYVFELSQNDGLKYMILRPGNAYGIGQMPFRGQGFIATAIASVLRGEPVRIFGRPGAVRDYVYITDMAEAIAVAMEKGEIGATYNIGSGRGHTNEEIVKEIESIVSFDGLVVKREYLPERPQDVARVILDSSRLELKTGWRPVVGLREGLKYTYLWLKNHMAQA